MVDKFIKLDEKVLNELKDISVSCIECGLCVKECEMLQHFCVSPKSLFKDTVQKKNMDVSIPYSCSMCKTCKSVCPKNLDLSSVFMNIRKYVVKNNKKISPLKGHRSVHMHQKLSFSRLFSGILGNKTGERPKRLFMPGCSLCAYNPVLVFKTFEYLKEDFPETALLVECCGKPSRIIGEEEIFQKKIKRFKEIVDSSGAVEIITACQSCFLLLKECGLTQNVVSLWNILADIGLPHGIEGIGKDSDIVFSIQDSCSTRYREDIQNNIRYIMEELGYRVREGKYYGKHTHCCGTGGMIFTTNPDISRKIMRTTAGCSSTDYILTYCASCRESMSMGGKKSLHLLDLIFGGRWDSNCKIPDNTSLYRNWINRYKVMRGGHKFE
ncbi:heterodisulfide reductase-related iron-sulfur binding cluster [Clostridium sp. JNZ X4-2]